MELKTKQMRKMLEPIQQHINKLQLCFTSVPVNLLDVVIAKSMLSGQLQSLTQKFNNLMIDNSDREEASAKLDDAIANLKHVTLLKDIDSLIKQIEGQNIDNIAAKHRTELLLDKFILVLKALEDLECLPLKQRFQDCLEYVRDMSAASEIEDFQNIKELGTSILEILEPLQKYRRSLVSISLLEKLALYTSQLCASFGMLVRLAQEQHCLNSPIYTCKKYICGRICTCCEMILKLLNGPNPLLEEEVAERENHFVYRMDLALDIILEMPKRTPREQLSECEELWTRLEDVFSHAMAITQVCEPYNFKAITGSCQSIVTEYEKLRQQLQSETPDKALNTLFMQTLTDALYRLERKVNIAVLTLAMELFGNPYTALKKLVMACGSTLSAKRRSQSDLNNLVEDFDQLFDQTIQIGIFAIACCKNISRNNKIRNCLAGFESLETELISAVTSFYLNPDNKEMHSSVKMLTAQWQLEMNKFQNAVNLVINSASFCQVILDNLQERITAMSDCLDNRQPVTQVQVQGIIQRASALSSQLTAIINDIGIENIDRQTVMMIRELKAAIFEANAASKTLLVKNATEPQQLRVIKRCELILNVVQRLQPAMLKIMTNTTHEKSRRSQGGSSHGTLSNSTNFPPTVYGLPRDDSLVYIRTPYTVKSCKPRLSIQPANSIVQKPSGLSSLIPYIKSGRALRGEHSIMYNTPRQLKDAKTESIAKNETTVRNLSTIRQHLFSRDSVISHNSNIDTSEESIDLTAILEKISVLSTSASATFPSRESSTVQKVSPKTTSKESGSDVKKMSGTVRSETESCSNKSVSTGQLNECTIPDRGDASLIMETCRKFNCLRVSNNKIKKSTPK